MGVAVQRGEFDTFSSPSANDSSRMELEFFEVQARYRPYF